MVLGEIGVYEYVYEYDRGTGHTYSYTHSYTRISYAAGTTRMF
jgi:hypothetical protein